jgi:hypothetical protein
MMSLKAVALSASVRAINLKFLIFQVGDKNYKRLTPTQTVGLKHVGFVIAIEKVLKVMHSTDQLTEAIAVHHR